MLVEYYLKKSSRLRKQTPSTGIVDCRKRYALSPLPQNVSYRVIT